MDMMLHSYPPKDLRQATIDVVYELVRLHGEAFVRRTLPRILSKFGAFRLSDVHSDHLRSVYEEVKTFLPMEGVGVVVTDRMLQEGITLIFDGKPQFSLQLHRAKSGLRITSIKSMDETADKAKGDHRWQKLEKTGL